MFRDHRVAVVVPAFDEARLVGDTLRTIPPYVDQVFVVDDASRDGTAVVAAAVDDPRVAVLRHAENRGVGGAIVTGYRARAACRSRRRHGRRQPDAPR
jgi:glycosyltransferase involved in cell wall biosynthesis